MYDGDNRVCEQLNPAASGPQDMVFAGSFPVRDAFVAMIIGGPGRLDPSAR
ncbi:hypothetical protein SAMN04489740_1545 [Arthrobacter alpinus]|uniref:Uncharacterized protein n=1 Tax=Arthrobacter alpinus TaxID=656366 RepID=A0A1H5J9H9_9MICC|nr:hypothetical protein SAMN04489740_1545 [Arthrobacter alpinus]